MRKYIRGGESSAADKIQDIWEIPGYTNGRFRYWVCSYIGDFHQEYLKFCLIIMKVPLIIMPKRQNRYVTICWRAVCIWANIWIYRDTQQQLCSFWCLLCWFCFIRKRTDYLRFDMSGRKPKEGNSFNDFSVFVDKCVVVLHYLYHLSEYWVLHYGKPHGIYTEKYIWRHFWWGF